MEIGEIAQDKSKLVLWRVETSELRRKLCVGSFLFESSTTAGDLRVPPVLLRHHR